MKRAVLIFGRFNPPTKGHEKLFRSALEIGKRDHADTVVFLSNTQDAKNPLMPAEKARYIKQSIPDLTIGPSTVRNPVQMLTWAKGVGYEQVIVLVGNDRVDSYTQLVTSWRRTEQPPKMSVSVVALSRIGHMDASLVSGTRARILARRGDVAGLQNILISGAATPAIAAQIVRKLQDRLGVQERTHMVIKGFRSWLREAEGDPPPGTDMKKPDRDPKDTKLPDEPPKEGEQNPPIPPQASGAPKPKPVPSVPPLPVDATEDDGRVKADREENQAKLVIHPPVRMRSSMITKFKMLKQQNDTY